MPQALTKIAYFDCPSGIAGDMCLGALVDAGVPLHYFQEQLARLGIKQEYQLATAQVHQNGQAATRFLVQLHSEPSGHSDPSEHSEPSGHSGHSASHGQPQELIQAHAQAHAQEAHAHAQEAHAQEAHAHHRHLSDIQTLITTAQFPPVVEDWSLKIFERLAQAEAAVHGCDIDAVHFHEVGATDAIVDIVGTCLGLHWLGVEQVYCSALPTGGGTVRAAHGRLPVPAPAVLKLFELGQVPVYSNGIERELVTPTGAAIATVLAGDRIGLPPAMTLQKVGLGAGTISLPLPNILRLWLGQPSTHIPNPKPQLSVPTSPEPPASLGSELITQLETQLDDLSPQAIGYVFEALLEAGALDVFTRAIAMKKNRPGTLITVLCKPDQADALEQLLFRETTTLGVRRQHQQRTTLRRAFHSVETQYGLVQVKVAWVDDPSQPSNVQPEYEDCARLAREHQQPWQTIHRLALESWYRGNLRV